MITVPSTSSASLLLLAALSLVPSSATAADLERHPYLQMAGPTSMTVVWTTLADSTGAVEYGTAPGQLNTTAQSGGSGTQHEVTLEGLTPGTRYYYRVLGDDAPLAGGDEAHTFETSPTPGSRAKFRAWIVGDSGTGGSGQAEVRDAMLGYVGEYPPHMYLHVGDMAYTDGTYDEFTSNFYAPYADILRNTPIWPALGNHEGSSSSSASQTGPYYGGYVLPTAAQFGGVASGTEAYYAFDYANVHFVVLDSHDSPREPDGPMLTWLSHDLMSTDQEWIVSFWHHPPYTKGSHDSDTESALVEMRENALPILEAGGVDIVFGGHSHIYERTYLLDGAYQTPSEAGVGVLDDRDGRVDGDGPYEKPPGLSGRQGAVYVVAGHGGTGVSQDDVHPLVFFDEVATGSCMLDVQENRLSLINIRSDGTVTDRVSILKGDGVVIDTPDGGETLAAGMQTPIRWATVGNIANVRLEYSTNDGEDWTQIEASIANEGSYDWSVPAATSTRALVRVSDASDATVRDESNAGFSISSEVPLTPVDFGATWRYHDSGEDLGGGWHAVGYDDSSWNEGPGELGYGDDDEATVLEDAEPNYPTAYFRRTFALPEDGEFIEGEVTARFDDGVAVWINGTEVFGVNVDNGTAYEEWASASSEDNELATGSFDPSVLLPGINVITAVAKQSSAGSSDLSFDLRLDVTVMLDPPAGGTDSGDDGTSSETSPGDGGGDGDGGSEGGSGGADGTGANTSLGGTDAPLPTAGADGDSGGCSCAAQNTPPPLTGWSSVFLLALFRRRKRRGVSLR